MANTFLHGSSLTTPYLTCQPFKDRCHYQFSCLILTVHVCNFVFHYRIQQIISKSPKLAYLVNNCLSVVHCLSIGVYRLLPNLPSTKLAFTPKIVQNFSHFSQKYSKKSHSSQLHCDMAVTLDIGISNFAWSYMRAPYIVTSNQYPHLYIYIYTQ